VRINRSIVALAATATVLACAGTASAANVTTNAWWQWGDGTGCAQADVWFTATQVINGKRRFIGGAKSPNSTVCSGDKITLSFPLHPRAQRRPFRVCAGLRFITATPEGMRSISTVCSTARWGRAGART
jgi:hypothetical protein